jgi:hypothetical protein
LLPLELASPTPLCNKTARREEGSLAVLAEKRVEEKGVRSFQRQKKEVLSC